MLRSMYSGISGMRGFQTKLDVVGNNIANVNTAGFKKGRVTFQDMMSQTTRGAQAATGNRGGVNPMQVGLGSQIGSIDNIHTQGFRQTTDKDRKSTRLNSSHVAISYAVFCLKKKKIFSITN